MMRLQQDGKASDKTEVNDNDLRDKWKNLQGEDLLPLVDEEEELLKKTHITRVMRATHFISMVKTMKNVLPRVLKWDDVYECYVLRVKIGNCSARHLLRDYYGQCWSFRTMESELLWRARNYDGWRFKHDVVMIESTVYDLVKSIQKIAVQGVLSCGSLVKIAAVDYSLPQNIMVGDVARALNSAGNLKETLFEKRPQFSDEKELRIIFDIRGRIPHKYLEYKISHGRLSYALSDKSMISRVVCHPKMSLSRVDTIRQCLIKYGWSAQCIRSDLYDLPKTVFKIF